MATNPAYNFGSFDSHGTGAYRYDPQNDAQANGRHRQNFFDNSEQRFMTARFADVTPFLAFDCVPGDRHTFKTNMRLRSYTLASPLMSTLIMNKDYYAVPLSSILPNTFEKFYANPIKGDDVPAATYSFAVLPVRVLIEYIATLTYPTGTTTPSMSNVSFYRLLASFGLLSNIVSSGSLLSSLGFHTQNALLRYVPRSYSIRPISGSGRVSRVGYDYYFQTFDEFIEQNRFGLTHDSAIIADKPSSFKVVYNLTVRSVTVSYTSQHPLYGASNVVYDVSSPSGYRKFIDDIISGLPYIASESPISVYLSYSDSAEDQVSFYTVSNALAWYYLFPLDKFYGITGITDGHSVSGSLFSASFDLSFSTTNPESNANKWFHANLDSLRFDVSYLVAYHQIMAQFFSVDAIDNVYTSKMWMENMASLATPYLSSFSYNGVSVPYDVFSNDVLGKVFFSLSKKSTFSVSSFAFCANLFCYENSLSYGDYFNGGRLEPLAVGDVNIAGSVDTDQRLATVNALDVTRNLQFQRFLNKVNRTGAAIWDYIRGIQGHIPVQVDPMPRFIAHESTVISGFEVENTTAGDTSNPTTQQGYSVTMLNSGESKFAFDIEVGGDPCVVLGLMSFDMRRAYSSTVDRAFFKRDRFDFFQPDLQNLGDQALYFGELSPCYPKFQGLLAEYPFAYHLRDTHYKQRYPVAFGGFTRQDILPSWANVIDFVNYDYVGDGLNSELIRNHNSDFDKFYQSLNGVTLSSYFHFIISIDNQLGSYREMQVKPLIAG